VSRASQSSLRRLRKLVCAQHVHKRVHARLRRAMVLRCAQDTEGRIAPQGPHIIARVPAADGTTDPAWLLQRPRR
jgi:hypothetical protein